MIKRLEKFIAWGTTIITSIVGLLSTYFAKQAETKFNNTAVMLLCALIFIVLASKVLEYFLEKIIEKSIWVRRQILGNHYVEGFWIDKVIEQQTKEVVAVAILKISFENKQLTSSGESYDLTGNKLGTFRTYISSYENFKLKYAYNGLNVQQNNLKIYGHGEYHFTESNYPPVSFSGYLYDTNHNEKIFIQAEKILDSSLLNNLDDNKTRIRIIKNFVKGAA